MKVDDDDNDDQSWQTKIWLELLKDKMGLGKDFDFEISQWSSSVFLRFRNFMGLYICVDILLQKS